MTLPQEHWLITKPAVRSERGVVAAQNGAAAAIGARVLREGGNAIDAAVTTALALAVLEPWMSGLGGGGYLVAYLAAERRVKVVDFHAVSPRALDPTAYPLTGGTDQDLFGWPAVAGARNLQGPLAIATPGAVDGLGLALETFGTIAWDEALAPAVELAREGHPVTWWTTLTVAGWAAALRENAAARAVYLPGGLPPVTPFTGVSRLDLGALAATLERLAKAGRRDFYEGEIARALAADLEAAGATLSGADLAAYHAHLADPLARERAGAVINLPPGLNAGPTFADALAFLPPIEPSPPGPQTYAAHAEALTRAYEARFATLGHDGDTRGQSSTTHLSVVDAEGNMVALTNTLVSIFGSKVLLPGTGVLMNNAIMWFDPRPGGPNALAPGVRPLCNMCPAVVTRDGLPWIALGASGGRRILPAVFQVASYLIDSGLDLDTAMATPRLNVEGGGTVEADARLPDEVVAAIEARLPVTRREALVAPNHFATPQVVLRDGETCLGAAQPRSPTAAAVGA